MDLKSLKEKSDSITQQFNALQDQIKNLNSQITQAQEESLKLAGEFRLASEMINKFEPAVESAKENKSATKGK